MYIKVWIDNIEYFKAWAGGEDTLKRVIEEGKCDELNSLIFDVLYCEGEVPTDTQINDFLWFDRDYIYEELEIEE